MSDSLVLSQYRSLFAESFKANIKIDNEILTEEESKVLQELEPDEVLDNLKDLITNLIEFKRFVRRTEALESLEAEISSIPTPVSEDTQSFYYSFKIVNEANEQLKKEIQTLNAKICFLENCLKDKKDTEKKQGVSIEVKNQENLKNDHDKLDLEKKASNELNQNRFTVENDLLVKPTRKSNIIKSVKFEYINAKKITMDVNSLGKKKNGASIASSPEKNKTSHYRSSSNVFVSLRQLR